jgi:nucleoside-diphosphate-sugar epimerase
MMDKKNIHVIFGTGPLGMAVMEELILAGKPVRMVNRRGVADLPDSVELLGIDASRPEKAARACEGAEVVYHCANVPYGDWVELFPPLSSSILSGAKQANARLIYGDNLYAYGPEAETMSEETPRNPVGDKPTMRAEMEALLINAHQSGEIEVAIAKGSDFYGPRVLQSHMGDRVFPNILQGKAASVMGNPDMPHTFTYIRDFARLMVLLGEREDTTGQVWHVPSAETLNTTGFVQRAALHLNTIPKVRPMPRLMLNLLSPFIPILKELKEVFYQFEQPFISDGSKAVRELGFIPTPIDSALEETIDWYKSQC